MKLDEVNLSTTPVEHDEPFAESLSGMIVTIVIVAVVLIIIGLLFYFVLEQHK